MDARLLVDSIVRQTTVLLAQISTAAGIRAPVAHLADQVFLSLSQEIERLGVGRKVVADMFGLALRSYQRKVQRLSESATLQNKTLWEAVLGFIESEQSTTRGRILERFRGDEESSVVAVLGDLVGSGLVYGSGRGASTLYRATSESERRLLEDADSLDTLAHRVWGEIFHHPGIGVGDLVNGIGVSEARIRTAVEHLLEDGRIHREGSGDDGPLSSAPFVIPVGSRQGWEAAVFDHFQAMALAIASKLQKRSNGWADDDRVGGSTLHFGVHPEHPLYDEVMGTLARLREQLNATWNRVHAFNEANPLPEGKATRVTVYVGQNVREPESEDQTSTIDVQSLPDASTSRKP